MLKYNEMFEHFKRKTPIHIHELGFSINKPLVN